MSTCLRAFSSFTTLVHDVYARVDQVRNTPYGCHAITLKGALSPKGRRAISLADTFGFTLTPYNRPSAHAALTGKNLEAQLAQSLVAMQEEAQSVVELLQARLDQVGVARMPTLSFGTRTHTDGMWEMLLGLAFVSADSLGPFSSAPNVGVPHGPSPDRDWATLLRRMHNVDRLRPVTAQARPWQVFVPEDITKPQTTVCTRLGPYLADTPQDSFHQCAVFDKPALLMVEQPGSIAVAPCDTALESLTTWQTT